MNSFDLNYLMLREKNINNENSMNVFLTQTILEIWKSEKYKNFLKVILLSWKSANILKSLKCLKSQIVS